MKKLITYDTKKKKYVKVGEIVGDTLIKQVSAKHFMRVVNGYGIQEVAFQQVVEKLLRKIVLKTKSGQLWESMTSDWLAHGHVADYGHGKQRFLSMKYMHQHRMEQEPITYLEGQLSLI